MKNRFLRARRLLAIGTLAILSLVTSAQAQSMEQVMAMPIPHDTAVRIGHLPNGMTYYIRRNELPKNRAEFYILHHVGAILENDAQNGLAHFTEHMAFNGTKHFPGKKLLSFLEHNGVKFGADVNAFTNTDVTCYNISDVPTQRKGLLDSCTQVLCDWSGDISFEHQEIDDERGVIIEEWRMRRNANWRAMEAKNQVLYRGCKYQKRNVIGTLELLKTFKYQTIKDFYHQWYRPEFQAIIIVGDFDVDEMEARVKRMAGALPKRKDNVQKPEITVPPCKGVEYVLFTDPEMQMTRMELIYKLPPQSKVKKNVGTFREKLVRELAVNMLNARFSEIRQQPNAPFLAGGAGYVNFIEPMDNMLIVGISKPGEAKKTLKGILTESQRIRQKGYTEGELGRAKVEMLSGYEAAYKERNKTKNSAYVQEYMSHFTDGTPIPGIEKEMGLAQFLLQTIKLADVNAMAKELMPGKDLVLFIQAPDSEKGNLPSEAQAKALFDEVYGSTLDAWVDNVKNEPLVSEVPTPGKIVSEKQNKQFGTTEWVLSNGIKVILKKTDYKDDEILMNGFAKGGKTLLATEDLLSSDVATSLVSMSGLGNFSAVELRKLSAGRNASAGVGIGTNAISLHGYSTTKPEDIEYMFQNLYLHFTAPRFDAQAFETMMGHLKTSLVNKEKDPHANFMVHLQEVLSQKSPRRPQLKMQNLDKVTLKRAERVYKQLFANAGNFTITIVGNIDLKSIKPYVLTYLANLPKGEKVTWKDDGVRFPTKNVSDIYREKTEVPKTEIAVIFAGPAKYTLENLLNMGALEHVLSLRCTEEIREKAGAAYSVAEQGDLSYFPTQDAFMLFYFPTDPEKADIAVKLVDEIFTQAKRKISDDDVEKARKHFLKSHAERVRTNRYWANVIKKYEETGIDLSKDYEKRVKALTGKSLQKAAAEMFKKAVRVQIMMEPEKK